jgi:hypothetical protein
MFSANVFNKSKTISRLDTKSTYCKRRISRYVEKIDRNNISFKAVPGIKRLHQVVSTKLNNDTLAVRNMIFST